MCAIWIVSNLKVFRFTDIYGYRFEGLFQMFCNTLKMSCQFFLFAGKYAVRFGPPPQIEEPRTEEPYSQSQTIIRNLTLDERAVCTTLSFVFTAD